LDRPGLDRAGPVTYTRTMDNPNIPSARERELIALERAGTITPEQRREFRELLARRTTAQARATGAQRVVCPVDDHRPAWPHAKR